METENVEKENMTLKIVSWNCITGKNVFHDKLRRIVKEMEADAYIISECPDPETDEVKKLLNSLGLKTGGWDGDKDSGVGIFIKLEHPSVKKIWRKGNGGHYASCSLYGKLNLLGIWIRDKNENYAQLFLNDLENNGENLDRSYVIAGDFNIDLNIYQKEYTQKIYELLESKGLVSAYHNTPINKEPVPYGLEEKKTYYKSGGTEIIAKKIESSHIDYIFVSKDRIKSFELGRPEDWIIRDRNTEKVPRNPDRDRSNHLPLIIEIKL
jgi:Exonuclease III